MKSLALRVLSDFGVDVLVALLGNLFHEISPFFPQAFDGYPFQFSCKGGKHLILLLLLSAG